MRYKFRAECFPDVYNFVIALDQQPDSLSIKFQQSAADVTAIVETHFELSEIKRRIKNVPSCHVIFQTIEREEDYTGERKHPNYLFERFRKLLDNQVCTKEEILKRLVNIRAGLVLARQPGETFDELCQRDYKIAERLQVAEECEKLIQAEY